VGCHASHHLQVLTQKLGADHSAVLLSAGDQEGDLYDQRNRIAQHVIAEGYQKSRPLSQRRRHVQTDLPGIEEYLQEIDHADQRLESGIESAHYHV
jgi:hypothetical protein